LLALVGLGLLGMMSAPVPTLAQGLVQLRRWEDRAVLVGNNGPGSEFYRLVAQVAWDKAAPRDPGRYQVHVTLPDGRVERQTVPADQGPGASLLDVYIPGESVQNLLPAAILITVQVHDAYLNAVASNPLQATIDQFPSPRLTPVDRRPFGWGRPLVPQPGGAAPLENASPEGWRFTRVFSTADRPGFFVAQTEASNRQVRSRLGDRYDPTAGRTDNFSLEADEQPALGLTPALARDYLEATSQADPNGLTYRLPTREEWLRAARAGKPEGFWWDGEVPPADAANFLGPEPNLLAGDTTVEVLPPPVTPTFRANGFGLFHAFGNVAEWASTEEADTFARLGGHFRTDSQGRDFSKQVFETTVTGSDQMGPGDDPGRAFVGVRPVVELDAQTGKAAIEAALQDLPDLDGVQVAYDPDRATAVLSGYVPSTKARRRADDRLRSLWFLSAVEDQIATPAVDSSRLATLGTVTGPARRIGPLTRWLDLVPVSVEWAESLPVRGSRWYVNVFLPGGAVIGYPLPEGQPGKEGRATFVVPVADLRAAGVPDGGPLTMALSLGAPATGLGDARIVSNLQPIQWTTANLYPIVTPGPESPGRRAAPPANREP
jgi:hypothetical protein